MRLRNVFLLIVILIPVISMVNGCYYDIEEELYPSDCDTSAVTYSGTIAPMISNNGCLSCHASPATNGGNNVLDNYNSIKQLVDAGVFKSGASRMPPSGAILGNCNIDKIQAWIDAGALNN